MEEWPTIGMDHLQGAMMMRQQFAAPQSVNGFDPYKTMLKRKQCIDEPENVDMTVQQYDAADIKEVEDFCRRYGIVGFNFGKMNPKAALQMLKNKMGVIEESKSIKKLLHD